MRAIAHYMTPQPWVVQLDESIAVARQLLAHHEIRHLPVLDGVDLAGMVIERDLVAATDRIETVSEVMTPAHEVDVTTSLDAVLEMMADLQWDAVVVTMQGQIEGIFTAMDAVRVLRDLVCRKAA
jgi:acetoin utilization protein AcuB